MFTDVIERRDFSALNCHFVFRARPSLQRLPRHLRLRETLLLLLRVAAEACRMLMPAGQDKMSCKMASIRFGATVSGKDSISPASSKPMALMSSSAQLYHMRLVSCKFHLEILIHPGRGPPVALLAILSLQSALGSGCVARTALCKDFKATIPDITRCAEKGKGNLIMRATASSGGAALQWRPDRVEL